MQVTMNKEEGVRTVVVGGKEDVQQQYCGIIASSKPLTFFLSRSFVIGTVGGQSSDFSTMDTEVKVHVLTRVSGLLFIAACLDRRPQKQLSSPARLVSISSCRLITFPSRRFSAVALMSDIFTCFWIHCK